MKAITLWPEWIWAILHLEKRVENRSWRPPRGFAGQRIALHAGMHIGGRAGRAATESGLQSVGAMAAREGWSSCVNMDRKYMLFSCAKSRQIEMMFGGDDSVLVEPHKPLVKGAIVGSVVFDMLTVGDHPPWGVGGMYHWHLKDLIVFKDPIPAKGRQRLWNLSDEQEKVVCEEALKVFFDRPTYCSGGPVECPKPLNVLSGTKIVVA